MNLSEESISDESISIEKEQADDFSINFDDLMLLEKKIPRKFAAGEIDKLTYVFGVTADQQINCVLSFNGFFDFNRLRKALTLIFYAEPVLGCRFVEMPEEAFWRRREDLHKIEYCSLESTTNLENSISNFLTASIDPTKDIPVQIRMFRTDKGDNLCLKVSHLVLDGGGIQEFILLLSQFYNRLKIEPTFLPEPNVESDRSLKQVFKRLKFWRKLDVISQLRIRKATWSFPWKSLKAKTRKYAIYRFSADQYRKIKVFSKKMKVTITDLIVTAYYRAMFKIKKIPEKKTMLSTLTANLRTYMPNYRAKSLCNLTASSHPKLSYIPGETFETSLKRIHKSTRKLKRKGPGLEAALFCRLLFSMPFQKAKETLEKTIRDQIKENTTYPIITNIGLVKSSDIVFDDLTAIDAFMLTPYMKAPGFLMGTMTFNETLMFTMAYFEESYDKKIIENFLNLMGEELITNICN